MDNPASDLMTNLGLTPVSRDASERYFRSKEEIRPGLQWWSTYLEGRRELQFGLKAFSGAEGKWRSALRHLTERGGQTFYSAIPIGGLAEPTEQALRVKRLTEGALEAVGSPFDFVFDLNSARELLFFLADKVDSEGVRIGLQTPSGSLLSLERASTD